MWASTAVLQAPSDNYQSVNTTTAAPANGMVATDIGRGSDIGLKLPLGATEWSKCTGSAATATPSTPGADMSRVTGSVTGSDEVRFFSHFSHCFFSHFSHCFSSVTVSHSLIQHRYLKLQQFQGHCFYLFLFHCFRISVPSLVAIYSMSTGRAHVGNCYSPMFINFN